MSSSARQSRISFVVKVRVKLTFNSIFEYVEVARKTCKWLLLFHWFVVPITVTVLQRIHLHLWLDFFLWRLLMLFLHYVKQGFTMGNNSNYLENNKELVEPKSMSQMQISWDGTKIVCPLCLCDKYPLQLSGVCIMFFAA